MTAPQAIEAAARARGVTTRRALAAILEIDPSHLTKYLNGDMVPSVAVVYRWLVRLERHAGCPLELRCGVDVGWTCVAVE